MRLRRLVAPIAAAVVGIATVVVGAPAATAAASGPDWRSCHGGGYFCAQVLVPLDYDDPHGVQIPIVMVKQPATDPAHRIGSLFLNPGGPGGSGVDFLLSAGHDLFTPAVRARFDLIGFDPRGINRSRPLQCFDTLGDALATVPDFAYPNSAAERATWFRDDRAVEKACANRGSAILDHMSTADVARDLDRLRQAVGDRGLTYYGVSYGSFLGNVYANLFPTKVRSLVIDGVLDPIAWTTGRAGEQSLPFSTRLHSALGAAATLSEFFRLCDAGGSACAFAPNSAERYFRLFDALRAHPIRHPGFRFDETELVGETLGAMYSSSGWQDFAQFLADLAKDAGTSTLTADRATLRAAHDERYLNFVEGFPGVACSDSVNPHDPNAWTRAAATAERLDGVFGPIWTWITSVCAHWPGQDADRYLGPFTHRTANPVLVVGNLYDPATRYQGAETAARLLPNSRLLTVDGWGHTSLFLSRCADRAIARYLLTSTTPAAGTVCHQDNVPFQGPAPAASRPSRPATTDPFRVTWAAPQP